MSGAEVCAGAAAWVLSSLEIRTRVCVNDVSPVPFPLSSPSTILNLSPFPGSSSSPSPHPMGYRVTSHGDGRFSGGSCCARCGTQRPQGTPAALFSGHWRGTGRGGALRTGPSELFSSVSEGELSPPGLWPEARAFHHCGGRNPAPGAKPSAGGVRTSARRGVPMRLRWEAKNLRDPVGARVNVCVSKAERGKTQ